MKKAVLLGSTGCLGIKTIELIEKIGQFQLIGLSANRNEELLLEQAQKHNIKHYTLTARDGESRLTGLATLPEADIIINNLAGLSGLAPTIAALKAGKTLLTANKESIVARGDQIMALAQPGQIIPLDSEHNAIFEILKKHPGKEIEKIILPCSGGPFLGKNRDQLQDVTPAQALNHPRWKMGAKVTIESATLINKGFEIIEAHHLFQVPVDRIQVLIHPECQVHAAVQFAGQLHAYIAPPDMSLHIENALRHAAGLPTDDKVEQIQLSDYNFSQPDLQTFPSIPLILDHHERRALEPLVQREEEAISDFLTEKISFLEIFNRLSA